MTETLTLIGIFLMPWNKMLGEVSIEHLADYTWGIRWKTAFTCM